MTDTDQHKRFVVFLFDYYYPCGGLNDARGSFDTLEEARAFAKQSSYPDLPEHLQFCNHRWDNADIYDRVEGKEVT